MHIGSDYPVPDYFRIHTNGPSFKSELRSSQPIANFSPCHIQYRNIKSIYKSHVYLDHSKFKPSYSSSKKVIGQKTFFSKTISSEKHTEGQHQRQQRRPMLLYGDAWKSIPPYTLQELQ